MSRGKGKFSIEPKWAEGASSSLAAPTFVLSALKKALALGQGFWFIPTLCIFALSLAALALLYLDQDLQYSQISMVVTLNNLEAESAKGLMEVIASSVITITSIAFSITLLVLTLASQQFGPRLIGSFIEDKRTQFVLGVFTSTFVYCLIVLRSIKTDLGGAFVPGMSVSFGLLMALICIFTLIYFIHHVAISIQADNVIKHIARNLQSDLGLLIDSALSSSAKGGIHQHKLRGTSKERKKSDSERQLNKGRELLDVESFSFSLEISAPASGYIQAINYLALTSLAKQNQGLFKLQARAGHHVLAATPLAMFYSDVQHDQAALSAKFEECLMIGDSRTQLQDPEFAIHQLVEMALRALSPGINDPYTAIHCIDQLGASFAPLACRDVSRSLVVDGDNEVRIITRQPTFEGLLECAFNQIRQNAQGHVSVIVSLLNTLASLLELATNMRVNMVALLKQVNAIEEGFESGNYTRLEKQSLLEARDRCYALADEELLRLSQVKVV